MNRFQRWYYIGQALGWDNLPRRAWQVAKGKLGLIRKALPGGEQTPAQMRANFLSDYQTSSAEERWATRRAQFFGGEVTSDQLSRVADAEAWSRGVDRVTDGLRAGEMVLYGHHFAQAGFPPDFNRDPLHDVLWPTPQHWSSYKQFDSRYADLKCVWEASRFSWAYQLARGHVRRPDAGLDDVWWQCLDAWDEQNPYGLTPNWACGQEASFRLFAWLFAVVRMPGTRTAAQWDRLTQLVWYIGRHVDLNINYARSQKNNHAISEAVGLWAIGLLFPELKSAQRWERKGLRILAAEVARQIAPDGSYVQNSMNYHRVMLDDLLFAAGLARAAGVKLPDVVASRAKPALDFLLQMVEPRNGTCPNYGPNDGAQVLQLSTCDYTDFRPVAQAAHYWLHGSRCYEAGPWDEKMLWLFGPESLQAETVPRARTPEWAAKDGGYYTMQGPRSWGMVRCHTHVDRPTQADMLHFDLWYDGLNLFRDGGSYYYYTEKRELEHFKSAAGHNTVTIDDQDQMIAGPSFLWLRWTKSGPVQWPGAADKRLSHFAGWHSGYERLPSKVRHHRRILRCDDTYVVTDRLVGSGSSFKATLRWRLGGVEWIERDGAWLGELSAGRVRVEVFEVDGGSGNAVRRTPEAPMGQLDPDVEGWESRYYAEKLPCRVLKTTIAQTTGAAFVTVIRFEDEAIDAPLAPLTVALDADDRLRLDGVLPADARGVTSLRRFVR